MMQPVAIREFEGGIPRLANLASALSVLRPRHSAALCTLPLAAALTLGLLFGPAGCGFNGTDDCAEGDRSACTCPDDSAGVRICSSQGRYSDCQCGGQDGGTSDGGGASGCPVDFTRCGASCVKTLEDPRACGGCDTQCAVGEVCISGGCQAGGDCRQTDCQGFTFCDQATGLCMPGCTTNTQCPTGEYCELGAHACDCAPGSDRCGLGCVLTDTDPLNCGACNQSCPSGGSCDKGSCSCPGATQACGNACVNTSSDRNNCGACAKACDPAASCQSSRCVCGGTLNLCGEACFDLQADPLHCGSCSKTCTTGQFCENGSCKTPPDCRVDGCAGQSYCDQNTGSCLPGCDSDASCFSGRHCDIPSHRCVCSATLTECGSACVDTNSDANHCGSCPKACSTGQFCSAAVCVDPALACQSYQAGNRLSVCQDQQPCTGSMECTLMGLQSTCVDTTPCASSPAGPCCGAGEFCGRNTGGILPTQGTFCCVPGEIIPDGLFGSVCNDGGIDIACVQDADCPAAWGRSHCKTTLGAPICVECLRDSHCDPGKHCNSSSNTCR